MAEANYSGSCHCGQVRYEVSLDLEQPALTCNCSICQRTGAMLSFVLPDHFTLKSGEEALTDYQFGRENIHHLFCSRCGVRSFARGQKADGTKMIAVNVRCLENIDLESVPTRKVDGRSR
jgi:hypothetical protein